MFWLVVWENNSLSWQGGHDSRSRRLSGHRIVSVRRLQIGILSPIRLHLLEVPQDSQIMLPTRNQVFKHTIQWGMFNIQSTIVLHIQRSTTSSRDKFLLEVVEKSKANNRGRCLKKMADVYSY